MADNTSQAGTDLIATDELVTINGAAAPATLKVQRSKMGFGVDGDFKDVHATSPLPTQDTDQTATGTILTSDLIVAAPVADGSFRSGASTMGSIVSLIQNGGLSEVSIGIIGLTSGTIYFEGSLDTTNGIDGNWAAVIVKFAGNQSSNLIVATANGIYRGNLASIKAVRARSVGTLMGTPTIDIRWSQGTGSIHHLSGLQAGLNRLGQMQLTGSPTAALLGLGSSVTAYGNLRVTAEPTNIFNDPFDGTVIDIINRWNSPVVTGMNITQASGDLIVTTTTTNSNSAYIDSLPTFSPLGVNFIVFASAIKLEAQASNLFASNQHRFWGLGTRPTTYAATTPLKDSIGFEVGTDGQIYVSVYKNGTAVFRTSTNLLGANLNTLITPSTGYVRFGMAIRADTLIFYINSTEFPAQSFTVSSVGYTLPEIQSLPIRIAAINASVGIVGASTFIVNTLALGDTGGTGHSIVDGVHGFRKATVGKSGGLSIKGASIIPQSSTFAAAAIGNTTGLDVSEAGNVSFIFFNTVEANAFGSGGTVVFEQSHNGTSWGLLQAVRNTTGEAANTFTLGANTANASMIFDAPVEGVNFVRVRVTAGVTTNGMTLVIQPGGMPFVPAVTIGQVINKGVQAANGLTTQDLKDGGRNITNYFIAAPILTTAAEVMQSLTGYKGNAAIAATVTPAVVTATKTYRITQIIATYFNVAALGSARFTLRANTAGVAVIGSPLVWNNQVGQNGDGASTAGHVNTVTYNFPDGIEFAAGTGIAVGMQGFGVVPTTGTIVGYGKIEILGFEY